MVQYDLFKESTSIETKFSQLEKASSPILVIDLGIFIVDKLEQP